MAFEVGNYRRRDHSCGNTVSQIKHLVDINIRGWDRFRKDKTARMKELTLGKISTEASYLGLSGKNLGDINVEINEGKVFTGSYRELIPIFDIGDLTNIIKNCDLNLRNLFGSNFICDEVNAYTLIKTILTNANLVARSRMDDQLKGSLSTSLNQLEDQVKELVGSEVYVRAVRLWHQK